MCLDVLSASILGIFNNGNLKKIIPSHLGLGSIFFFQNGEVYRNRGRCTNLGIHKVIASADFEKGYKDF